MWPAQLMPVGCLEGAAPSPGKQPFSASRPPRMPRLPRRERPHCQEEKDGRELARVRLAKLPRQHSLSTRRQTEDSFADPECIDCPSRAPSSPQGNSSRQVATRQVHSVGKNLLTDSTTSSTGDDVDESRACAPAEGEEPRSIENKHAGIRLSSRQLAFHDLSSALCLMDASGRMRLWP